LPLIKDFGQYRYFLIEGGRGGGKSQAVARWILYLAEKYKIRIVCGREIQNSIKESVYSLLTDLVQQFNLNFMVFAKSIVSRSTATEINFRGFREQGAFNIQGMEAIDIVWIDESQALTKQTLDVLIPTIRKDTAKIIFTMNRFIRNDPAYAQFIGRADCLHINLNFMDNPYCTNALKHEAEECKKKSDQDYNHIWLGLPLDKTEDAVFTHTELVAAQNAVYPQRQGYSIKIGGFDIARFGDDKCAAVIIQQMGALHWEVISVDQWDHKDLDYTKSRIFTMAAEKGLDKAIIDEDGMGAGPLDNLAAIERNKPNKVFSGFRNPPIGYQDNKWFGNNRTANTYKLKELISKGHICIKDEALIEELETLRYEFNHDGRRTLVSKDKMKKDGYKSPNMADALIMAVSLIDEVVQGQTNPYGAVRGQRHTESDNLFAIAGVR